MAMEFLLPWRSQESRLDQREKRQVLGRVEPGPRMAKSAQTAALWQREQAPHLARPYPKMAC